MKTLKTNIIILTIVAIAAIVVIGSRLTRSELLGNDVEVTPKSYLTYYLDVTYDGVDRNGVASSDAVVSDVSSGYMFVEDKIPEGLEFDSFVTTNDGTIGAYKRSDETPCLGKVIDDTEETTVDSGTWNADNSEYYYHGLHYNPSTRTVSFKVKGLKAGCQLTVGVKTRTPDTIDDPDTSKVETRRDFYNIASIKEDALTVFSNTAHAFMGVEVPTYKVIYNYTGTVPGNAPELPAATEYQDGVKVGVASPINIEGYTFSGWTTSDVNVANGSFTMPTSDVTFTGSFTSIPSNDVKYVIEGVTPPGYEKPVTKPYYPDTTVNFDSLKEGDVFNGYRFNGWTTTDVEIVDGSFTMPNSEVTVKGNFTEITYKVTYAFYDTVLPPNADSLLPAEETHKPGDTVTLPNITDPAGYHFLGWYKENNFAMPEEDIVIYGEWKVQRGVFEPTIVKEIIEPKDSYEPGDVIEYKITITNTASYTIHDVMVKENNDKAVFKQDSAYSIESSHIAKIDSMAAGSSVVLYVSYTVLDTDAGTVSNEAQIIGALADNNYDLKTGDYKATADVTVQSHLIVHHYIKGTKTKVYDDEESEVEFGTEYNTSSKETNVLYDEYKEKYEYYGIHEGELSGTVDKRVVEVIYYYSPVSILPQTFDSIMIFIGVLAVSVVGLVVVFFLLKKKK